MESDVSNRIQAENPATIVDLDDLLRGADEIASFVYGPSKTEEEAKLKRRKVYHNAPGFPLFNMGALICARKSKLRDRLAELERAGIEKLQQKQQERKEQARVKLAFKSRRQKKASKQPGVKPRRRGRDAATPKIEVAQ
jgi:hypothetical protein